MSYWIFITLTLIKMKYTEGRTELCGQRSIRGQAIERTRRRARREEGEEEGLLAAVDPRDSDELDLGVGPSGSGSGSRQ
jgi:hypothetical protein